MVNVFLVWMLFCWEIVNVWAATGDCVNGLIVGWDGERCFSLDPIDNDATQNPTLEGFLDNLIEYMAWTIALVAVLGVMLGGIMLMTAYGEEEKIQKGKAVITASVIGLVVVISSYLIVSLVQTLIYSGF